MKLLQHYFAKKTLFLAGLVMLGLFALPVTVLMLQKQQQTQSSAVASTVISFSPASSTTSPLIKNVNDTFSLDVMIDPVYNAISILTLVIQYDATKLRVVQNAGFQPDLSVFSTILEGPVYTTGQVAIKLSIGSDPTKAVQSPAKAGTLQFVTVGSTGTGTTNVTFSAQTSALSVGANDQASENVIANTQPAVIMIPGDVPGPTIGTTGTIIPTDSLTPTIVVTPTGVGGPNTTPPVLPTASPSATPTLIPGPASPRFHGLQTSTMAIITARIQQCNQLVAKVTADPRIPAAQKDVIKTELSSRCARWQTLLQQVSTATNDAQIRQAVVTAINDMMASYTATAQQLTTLNQGMQGLAKAFKGNKGKSVQSLINSMNSQLGTISFHAGQGRGHAGKILVSSASATMIPQLTSVKLSLAQIKAGFLQMKADLKATRHAMRQNQPSTTPTGTAPTQQVVETPTATP